LYSRKGWYAGNGSRFAGWAVPSGLTSGIGIAVVRVGMLILEVVALAPPETVLLGVDCRFIFFELDEEGVGTSKEMKNGVDSPSKGAEFPSVVFPRNVCSSNSGGEGDGWKVERAFSKLLAHERAVTAPELSLLAVRLVAVDELS